MAQRASDLPRGPWAHGQWSNDKATSLGHIDFGADTAAFYQKEIELPFFNHFLKGNGEHGLPEAYVFETGVNRWRKFDTWPPAKVQERLLYLREKGKLTTEAPAAFAEDMFDSFVKYQGLMQNQFTPEQRAVVEAWINSL